MESGSWNITGETADSDIEKYITSVFDYYENEVESSEDTSESPDSAKSVAVGMLATVAMTLVIPVLGTMIFLILKMIFSNDVGPRNPLAELKDRPSTSMYTYEKTVESKYEADDSLEIDDSTAKTKTPKPAPVKKEKKDSSLDDYKNKI